MNNPNAKTFLARPLKTHLYALIPLTLLILISMGCNVVGPAIALPTPAPTRDPWEAAVQEAQAALANNPDFEKNLSSYQTDAAQIATYAQYAEKGQSALDYIDKLKNTQIPLVGNAWDILLNLLEENAPGSRDSLVNIETSLREALAFNKNIQSMRDMEAVIAASQAFRSQPTPANLKILYALLAEPQASLSGLSENVAGFDGMVASASKSLDSLRASLDKASENAQFPLVGEAIKTLRSMFDGVTLPVVELQDYTKGLQARVQADLAVMSAIQGAVNRAEGS